MPYTTTALKTQSFSPIVGVRYDVLGEKGVATNALDRSFWKILGYSSQQGPYPATRLVDGNASTFWATQSSNSGWVAFDLSYAPSFDGVRIKNRSDNNSGHPNTFDIYVSDDGANWGSPIGSFTGENSQGTEYDRSLGSVYAKRYLKLVINSIFGSGDLVFAEFNLTLSGMKYYTGVYAGVGSLLRISGIGQIEQDAPPNPSGGEGNSCF
jgi:hypothetical protein